MCDISYRSRQSSVCLSITRQGGLTSDMFRQPIHPALKTPRYDDLDCPIVELFERVVAWCPAKLALSDKARRLTFREAWQTCLHLASRITAVTPEGRPVGILMPSNALFPVC